MAIQLDQLTVGESERLQEFLLPFIPDALLADELRSG